ALDPMGPEHLHPAGVTDDDRLRLPQERRLAGARRPDQGERAASPGSRSGDELADGRELGFPAKGWRDPVEAHPRLGGDRSKKRRTGSTRSSFGPATISSSSPSSGAASARRKAAASSSTAATIAAATWSASRPDSARRARSFPRTPSRSAAYGESVCPAAPLTTVERASSV